MYVYKSTLHSAQYSAVVSLMCVHVNMYRLNCIQLHTINTVLCINIAMVSPTCVHVNVFHFMIVLCMLYMHREFITDRLVACCLWCCNRLLPMHYIPYVVVYALC